MLGRLGAGALGFCGGVAAGTAGSLLAVGLPDDKPPPTFDSSQLFAQTTPQGCGPAALSWVLFGLGDTVFPEALALHERDHSLHDLRQIATARGFAAQAVESSPQSLVRRPGTAYVLHVTDDHFVGCFPQDGGAYQVFDPAAGRTVTVSREELNARWTGQALRVSVPAPP